MSLGHHSDGDDPRTIFIRPGIGATAGIIQKRDLRFHRLTIDQPCMILVGKGVKTLYGPTGAMTVRAGQAVAISAGHSCDVVNHPGAGGVYEARWLVWDADLLVQAPAHHAALQGSAVLPVLEPAFSTAFDRALDAIAHPSLIPQDIARHRLAEILLWLADQGVCLAPPQTGTLSARLRGIFAAAPAQFWTATAVAQKLGLGEATLRRRLSMEGMSFSDLLADVRMSSALTLLQSTDLPVNRIALDVGYDSPSRFAVRFRKRFGFPPSAVRGHKRI